MDTKPFRTTRRITNLRQGRNDWYKITNSAGPGQPAQVHIYDEIGYFGVTAQNFLDDLGAVTGPVELHLNTPGGEVFDGIAIYSALRQRGDVSVVVDSLAASIGSVIAMGGDTIAMAPGSQMMIHDGFGMGIGNAADMRELADLLDRQSDNIASIYAERTGKPSEHWRALMRAEKWFTAGEAVEAGLADSVLARNRKDTADMTAGWDLSIFAAAPYQPEPYEKEPGENVQCPVCEKLNAPDARYCDQCGTKLAGRTDVTGKLASTTGGKAADSGAAPEPVNETETDVWAEFSAEMFRL